MLLFFYNFLAHCYGRGAKNFFLVPYILYAFTLHSRISLTPFLFPSHTREMLESDKELIPLRSDKPLLKKR